MVSNMAKTLQGILGILFALVFFYIGLSIGSSLGDKMAEIRGVSYESYTSGITVLIFMAFLLIIGYLIHKLIKIKIFSKFFLWTLIIVDGLYIIFTLYYLLM